MRKKLKNVTLLAVMAVTAIMMVTGCTDNKATTEKKQNQ